MERTQNATVLVAMSGGVDSAVTALLLRNSGHACIGATMLLRPDHGEKACGSTAEAEDAAAVAALLGIPHKTFDFSDRFADAVIRRFAESYENGRTPNPCIDCNRYLKFESLFRPAAELGCSHIATGHYARVEQDVKSGRYLLKKAVDASKDQSYVLWSLRQEQLARIIFPLGGMTKAEVRELAAAASLPNAKKQDSQDICFVPDGKYAEFLQSYRGKEYPPGDFVDQNGRVLGQHRGIIRYTVGQKKGLGLVLPEPLYVRAVDPVTNTVQLAPEEALFCDRLIAHDINLISCESIPQERRVQAKIRYRQAAEWATVLQTDADTLSVVFDRPQRAVTPGQSVVLYDGDTVVGGGIIA